MSSPKEAMKMIKHLEKMPYEKKLKDMCIFTLEKKSLTVDLITVFLYLKAGLQRGWRLSLPKD